MIIVYGTASSGKSKIAEDMAVQIARNGDKSLVYLATMEGETEAARIRIKKHRKQREGKGFYTIEEPYRLVTYAFSVIDKVVLLECMSNYCANVYFKRCGDKPATDNEIEIMTDEISNQVFRLNENAYEMVVVSNDIFRDGKKYDKWTESYQKLLANVNERLAKRSNKFYEVTSGLQIEITG